MKHVSTYVSNGLADLSGIIAHYKTYLNYVRTDFRKLCLIVIALVVLCFVCRMVFESQRNKVITLMLSVVVAGVMFLLSFGLYPVLEEPLFEPRSMFGVGVYITFVFLAAQGTEPKAFLVNVLAVILVWNFFTFSFTYGDGYSGFIYHLEKDLFSLLNWFFEFKTDMYFFTLIHINPVY